MSSDVAPPQDERIDLDTTKQTSEPPAPAPGPPRKRPRLDFNQAAGERKRGKTVFGILVGTLNKAKIEDKERNASDAAKKRQLTEQRLQIKLKKETDSVRRAEEAKKDKTTANRKEEELQLKDSVYKLRRARLPLLANFLLTSDTIPSDDSSPPPPASNPLAHPPRSHPPPLYYLPAVLLPSQEAFLSKRKVEVAEAIEKEWSGFREERTAGITDVAQLRQRVVDEEARRSSRAQEKEDMETDSVPPAESQPPATSEAKPAAPSSPKPSSPELKSNGHSTKLPSRDAAEMDIDDGIPPPYKKESSAEKKDEPSAAPDDEDAVEY